MVLRVRKMLEERAATCIQNMLCLWLPKGFASPTLLMVALGKVGRDDRAEELVGICLLNN